MSNLSKASTFWFADVALLAAAVTWVRLSLMGGGEDPLGAEVCLGLLFIGGGGEPLGANTAEFSPSLL